MWKNQLQLAKSFGENCLSNHPLVSISYLITGLGLRTGCAVLVVVGLRFSGDRGVTVSSLSMEISKIDPN